MYKPEPKFKKGQHVTYDQGQGRILDEAYACHLDSYSYSIVTDLNEVDFVFEKDIDLDES